MMDITPLVGQDRQIIQSYSAAGFRINGTLHPGAVMVFPDCTLVWDIRKTVEDLILSDFQLLLEQSAQLDVVLFGSGARMSFLRPDLRQGLRAAGLTVEAMDSGAACRTYNVLMAEGRRVAAALLPSL